MEIKLRINGDLKTIEAPGDMPLLWALRDLAGLKGTKFGCGKALCGACTVLIDGEATRSCQAAIEDLEDTDIRTIESMAGDAIGAKLQAAWITEDVPQCGYCQSGQIVNAAGLLAQNPDPSDEDIDDAMEGNICRCGAYSRIKSAIKRAAQA